MFKNIEIDINKLNDYLKNFNDSNQEQWLENVKGILMTVSKCINEERYIEAAQLVFAVIIISTIYYVF